MWVINPRDSLPVSCATGYKSQTTSLTFDKVTSYSESLRERETSLTFILAQYVSRDPSKKILDSL